MKLIFASPTYGTTEPAVNIAARVAIMHAAVHGHTWLGDASPNRTGWESARNSVAREVAESEYPDDAAVFWCDSDIVLPKDAITRLADHGKEFVTGIYFQRAKPYHPLVARFNGTAFQWILLWPANVLAPIDGCGFGCVLTSVGMLRTMGDPWFKAKDFSEDFDFCMQARVMGYQLHMDTAVLCGHLPDPKPITFEDFKTERAKVYSKELETEFR
jgi:hypothetical protein